METREAISRRKKQMQEYKVEIGIYTYNVIAENATDAKRLAAYQHKSNNRDRGLGVQEIAKYLAKAKRSK